MKSSVNSGRISVRIPALILAGLALGGVTHVQAELVSYTSRATFESVLQDKKVYSFDKVAGVPDFSQVTIDDYHTITGIDGFEYWYSSGYYSGQVYLGGGSGSINGIEVLSQNMNWIGAQGWFPNQPANVITFAGNGDVGTTMKLHVGTKAFGANFLKERAELPGRLEIVVTDGTTWETNSVDCIARTFSATAPAVPLNSFNGFVETRPTWYIDTVITRPNKYPDDSYEMALLHNITVGSLLVPLVTYTNRASFEAVLNSKKTYSFDNIDFSAVTTNASFDIFGPLYGGYWYSQGANPYYMDLGGGSNIANGISAFNEWSHQWWNNGVPWFPNQPAGLMLYSGHGDHDTTFTFYRWTKGFGANFLTETVSNPGRMLVVVSDGSTVQTQEVENVSRTFSTTPPAVPENSFFGVVEARPGWSIRSITFYRNNKPVSGYKGPVMHGMTVGYDPQGTLVRFY